MCCSQLQKWVYSASWHKPSKSGLKRKKKKSWRTMETFLFIAKKLWREELREYKSYWADSWSSLYGYSDSIQEILWRISLQSDSWSVKILDLEREYTETIRVVCSESRTAFFLFNSPTSMFDLNCFEQCDLEEMCLYIAHYWSKVLYCQSAKKSAFL